MSGIAGINKPDKCEQVSNMLDKISHRGKYEKKIFSTENSTLGIVLSKPQSDRNTYSEKEKFVKDEFYNGHFAIAKETTETLELTRDQIGIAPLYYGFINDGKLSFASEVKALMEVTCDINELHPGTKLINNKIEEYYKTDIKASSADTPKQIANQLYQLLDNVIRNRVSGIEIGSWLSGGLDSSVLATLAQPYAKKLYSFSSGLKDAPDLKYAQIMADYLKSDHHEIVVTLDDMIRILPEVIYHLESFDQLLVRSSITNYFAAKEASNYVEQILSGEGGDELFGGYLYLKNLPLSRLNNELLDITGRLHNTALQRVDRCALAFGTEAHLIFLDPQIVRFAFQIPPELKIRSGIEKWILRKAMESSLPETILNRTKAKFWEGAGVCELLSGYASGKISNADFELERNLDNGWIINTKEEFYYYRIFKEHFGVSINLDWMGRTKKS
ncbi:MAG: asparagine synthase-related protein [Melioribacteraceae bacterium]|nr:asparagine synthase-related protein [Melioribacteraceae bacterium]